MFLQVVAFYKMCYDNYMEKVIDLSEEMDNYIYSNGEYIPIHPDEEE